MASAAVLLHGPVDEPGVRAPVGDAHVPPVAAIHNTWMPVVLPARSASFPRPGRALPPWLAPYARAVIPSPESSCRR